MRPLHRMNPARVGWIAARVRARFRTWPGCGCWTWGAARGWRRRRWRGWGFDVLGLDAAAAAIAAAVAHAAGASGLALAYRVGVAEDLLAEGAQFPVVTALEVIEHVPDPAAFLRVLAGLLAPGGLLFAVDAEPHRGGPSWRPSWGRNTLLRWLPVGTHDWQRFLTPAELARHVRDAGLRLADIAGLSPDPLRGGWRIGRDLRVNYLLAATRAR